MSPATLSIIPRSIGSPPALARMSAARACASSASWIRPSSRRTSARARYDSASHRCVVAAALEAVDLGELAVARREERVVGAELGEPEADRPLEERARLGEPALAAA